MRPLHHSLMIPLHLYPFLFHMYFHLSSFLPSLQSMKPTTAPEDASPSLIDSRIGLQGVPTKLRQQQRLARLTQRSSSRSLANGNKNNNGSSSRSMNTYGSGAYSGYSSGGGGEEVEWVEKEPLVNGIAQFKHADHLANEMRAYLGVASTGGGGISSEGTMLMPKWTKASRDPGDKLGRVAGGYGRKVDDTSVRGCAHFLPLLFILLFTLLFLLKFIPFCLFSLSSLVHLFASHPLSRLSLAFLSSTASPSGLYECTCFPSNPRSDETRRSDWPGVGISSWQRGLRSGSKQFRVFCGV